jgi:hypothetical protein
MTATDSDIIECPFCHDSDFDLIGLKIHLVSGHCEELEKITLVQRIPGLWESAEEVKRMVNPFEAKCK